MDSLKHENEPLDLEELTARCLGQLDLVDRILGKFNDSVDDELAKLEKAVLYADTDEIARQAHRIKGTSGTVSAHGLRECAERLETFASAREGDAIERAVVEIRQEYTRLSEAITQRRSSS